MDHVHPHIADERLLRAGWVRSRMRNRTNPGWTQWERLEGAEQLEHDGREWTFREWSGGDEHVGSTPEEALEACMRLHRAAHDHAGRLLRAISLGVGQEGWVDE